jgi:adenylate cyclase
MKILVVDDEPDLEMLIKQKFRKKIREKQYEFLFVQHGKQALEVLDEHQDVDIVLSDINMPVMDGLTLLGELNETHHLLKSVIVSAYGDMENIRTAMNRGAFDFVTKPINFFDLELTIEKTFNHVRQLRETLKAVKENNILKMYVDETVLNFMDSKTYESSLMASESTEASVVFVDICGFTAISETEPPDLVVKLLNNYFEIMVQEIIDQGGFIDKFIGDAIMAVFRGDHHLDRAIDACLAMRNEIAKQPIIAEHVKYKPNVSIGINSGELVSGNIGSESLKRLDYTVIGDVVNTASRLESAASPGQILISEESYGKVKEFFQCEKVGEINMKNKAEPMVIYKVIE